MKALVKLITAVALVTCLLLPACGESSGSGGQAGSLAGRWQVTAIDGVPVPKDTMVFTFQPDGTGNLSGMGQSQDFVWALNNGRLTLTGGGESDTLPLTWLTGNQVQVVIDGDTLLMTRA